MIGKQTTIARSVSFTGIGVHSGKPATITLNPAEADRGIVFVRTDLAGGDVEIPAIHSNVVATELCTVIGKGGHTVATIEHLMAALRASAIDNVVVEIDGPEMPIADGCSADFLDLLDEAGAGAAGAGDAAAPPAAAAAAHSLRRGGEAGMNRHPRATLLLLALLVLAAALLSLLWGQMDTPAQHVLRTLAEDLDLLPVDGSVPQEQRAVIEYIRLPRTLTGLLVGGGLAVSGAVLQGIFMNPLADPSVVGVSSGASVGAILAIASGLAATHILVLPLFALLGALLAVGMAVLLSRRHGRIAMLPLLLAGIVVGIFLSAVTAAILTIMEEHKLQQYLFWTIGGLDYRTFDHVWLGALPITFGTVCLLLLSRQLNVLSLGDLQARAVGIAVGRLRLLLLSLAALTTATCVCISGNIGFVGLVVPHMMRFLTGPDHRRLLPASLLGGAAFLILCDTAGRVLLPGHEIRVGIMTAFIGAPYFLWLLRRALRRGLL